MQKKVFEKGQALITLLFFTVMGVTITSAAVVMILVNSLSGTKQQQGMIAYEVAQSGADNALIRLLRNPSYTGETLTVGTGQTVITVSGTGTSGDPYIILSKAQQGVFTREIQVTATYQNNLLTVTQRKEVYN
jgi:hypothetical protein